MLQQRYVAHTRQVLKDLMAQAKLPPYPQLLWETVLLNQYIDLNKVHAIWCAEVPDEEIVYSGGRFKFLFNGIQGQDSIKSQGAWLAAFEYYSDAVTFAYPHRATELIRYRKFILQQFGYVDLFNHWVIIEFDQNIRTQLASDPQLTFDDAESFQTLFYSMLGHGT